MNSIFEEAKKRRLQKEEEEKFKSTQTYSDEFIPKVKTEWVGIQKTKEIVGRIIGNPHEMRKNSWDVKIILYSGWLNDSKTGFVKIIWPMIESGEKFLPDPEWILTKLYNKVTDGNWAEYTDDMVNGDDIVKKVDGKIVRKKGGKELNVYWNHIHSNKNCFQRLQKQNNIRATDTFPRSVFPGPRVIMNWIDRHDDWCKENKHTKLLTAKKFPYTFENDEGEEQTIYYIDRGIPFSLYQKIWENVVETRGHWDLDLVLKLGSDKNYIVRDALEEKISEESKKFAVSTPLTEEEKIYEKYDLDAIFKSTSYVTLRNNLLGLFKLVDSELNTTFTEELEELAFEEAKEKSELSEEESKIYDVPDNTLNETNKEKLKTQEEEVTRTPRETKPEVRTETNVEQLLESLNNWKTLDKLDKSDMIKNIEKVDENNNIIWKSDANLLPCDNCEKLLPNTVLSCPYCGTHFNTGG